MKRYYCESSEAFYHNSPSVHMLLNTLQKTSETPNRILDLGCGNGRNSLSLARKYQSHVDLVDSDLYIFNQTSKAFLDEQISFSFIQSKVEKLCFNKDIFPNIFESYDVILLSYVLQNIDPSFYPLILDFCRKICKGYLLIDVYYNKSHCNPYEFISIDDINWYGLTYEELITLLIPRFSIMRYRVQRSHKYEIINILANNQITSSKCLFYKKRQSLYSINNCPIIHFYPSINKKLLKEPIKIKIKKLRDLHLVKLLFELYPIKMDKVLEEINNWSDKKEKNISNFDLALKLLWVCRSYGVPVYIEEIINQFGIKFKHIRKAFIQEPTLPRLNLSDYILRIIRSLNLPMELIEVTNDILNETSIDNNLSLRVISGCVVIKAAEKYGTIIKNKDVAMVLGISPISLKKFGILQTRSKRL